MKIAIASWPEAVPTFGYQYPNQLSGCGSFWLSLREVPATNLNDSGDRIITQIGIYVWFDYMGNLTVEPRLRDVHSMTLSEAEKAVKLLRKMCKLINTGTVRDVNPSEYISDTFKKLGIKYTLQYRPLRENTLASPDAVVEDLVRQIQYTKGQSK